MKMNLFLIVITASILLSCSVKNNQTDESPLADSLVTVSAQQFSAMNMEIGKVSKVKFADFITVQGIIEPKPNAKAYVTSPVEGIIKTIKVNPSAKVSKGQSVVVIEGPEVMSTQTAFVEVYNQHLMANANYERLAQLSQNGIASHKELLQAESEYHTLKAKLHSYRILLSKIGLDPDEILKGNFSGEAYLISPIDGTVSRVETAIGKPVTTDSPIAEVIDTQNFLLKFYVFINQVHSVKTGQNVEIALPGTNNTINGNVISVGLDANTENKAVECFASISQFPKAVLVSGMRVSAKVFTNFNDGWALPSTALHQLGGKNIVYVQVESDSANLHFKKVPLQVGIVQDTIVQVFDSTLTNVLVKGGYELFVDE